MNLIKVFFYLFLVFIPFGTRVLIYQFTTGFHEYEAVFLYASDVFLVLFLAVFWFSKPTPSKKRGFLAPVRPLSDFDSVVGAVGVRPILGAFFIRLKTIITNKPIKTRLRMFFSGVWFTPKILLIIFLLFAGLSIFWSWDGGLAIYNFFRLVLLVAMAFAIGKIIKEGAVKLDYIFAVIAGSAVLQSLIGFIQFLKQFSLGLGFLGESVLGPFIGGTAKIIVEGAPIMRVYGTFSHPNVLAAFLLLGLFSCYYLWFRIDANIRMNADDTNLRIISMFLYISIAVFLFAILLGLILTFSRTAWAIAALGSIWLISKENGRKAVFLLVILISIFLFLFFNFSSFIFPRAQIFADEPAVTYRLVYNNLGWDLIKNHPFGVGIGNQVLYSVKNGVYEKFGMDKVWQWQPIHNIYFLVASEIGVLGLSAFLVFIAMLLIYNLQFTIYKKFHHFLISQFLISLLIFGLFDHFLWTLQSGRLMLWLVIGILISVSRAHSTMDSIPPSGP